MELNISSDFSESGDEEQILQTESVMQTQVMTLNDTNDFEDIIISESNPKTLERIICIELVNNDKIFLNYSTSWTIGDVSYF
jgi:hypothetical protein